MSIISKKAKMFVESNGLPPVLHLEMTKLLKEQDRDTRHSCADAVCDITNTYESPTGDDVILVDDAMSACINNNVDRQWNTLDDSSKRIHQLLRERIYFLESKLAEYVERNAALRSMRDQNVTDKSPDGNGIKVGHARVFIKKPPRWQNHLKKLL